VSAVARTEEVGEHRQSADAQPAERGSRRNVAIQLVNHRLLAVAAHYHLLLLQLLCNLPPTATTTDTSKVSAAEWLQSV